MNMFKITAATVAATAASAFAGPVTFEFDGTARGRTVSIMSEGFHTGNVFAGSIRHIADGESIMTYCIEPTQWAQTGTMTFERVSLERGLRGQDSWNIKAAAIAELADSLGASIWSNSADRDTAAAFQLAVWEIVRDLEGGNEAGSLAFDSGSFRVNTTGSLVGSAQTMLSGLTFARGSGAGYNAYIDDGKQDFMGQNVPAPAASIVLAGAAAPMFFTRRRKATTPAA